MARPFKQTHPGSHDWDARADKAFADAQDMPNGPERNEMMRKVALLRAGADMRRALSQPQS